MSSEDSTWVREDCGMKIRFGPLMHSAQLGKACTPTRGRTETAGGLRLIITGGERDLHLLLNSCSGIPQQEGPLAGGVVKGDGYAGLPCAVTGEGLLSVMETFITTS